MHEDRDRKAAGMVATMDPIAINGWLMVQEDRQYADDMRKRLNHAWSESAAVNGATRGEI